MVIIDFEAGNVVAWTTTWPELSQLHRTLGQPTSGCLTLPQCWVVGALQTRPRWDFAFSPHMGWNYQLVYIECTFTDAVKDTNLNIFAVACFSDLKNVWERGLNWGRRSIIHESIIDESSSDLMPIASSAELAGWTPGLSSPWQPAKNWIPFWTWLLLASRTISACLNPLVSW